MTEKEYAKLVKELAPVSPTWKDCLNAFWIGGLICALGQGFISLYTWIGLDSKNASTAASMSLVTLSALLTGFSLYDNIAKYAGAGTLVPITGFANAIAAPAVEFKTEGFITGTAAKLFQVAGPVLVFGISYYCRGTLPDRRDVCANALVVTLALTLLSTLLYIRSGNAPPADLSRFVLPAALGGLVGGLLLGKITPRALGKLFAALLIVSGIFMLVR